MAVELHTSLPSHFLPDDNDDVVSSQHNHKDDIHHSSALNPLPEVPRNDNDDDFISELTHRMARFLLPDDDTFDFSSIDLDSSRDSKQGSPEGSSQEASPPATPEERCWNSSYDLFGTFENMKLNETGNSNNQLLQSSNLGLYSYQSLIQEQIRAIELYGVKQEQVVVSPKPKPTPRRKNQAQTNEAKKGNGRKARPPRPGPQQGGAGMRVLFLDGPGSRAGTGVFLPRGGGATSPSESTNKQGKGCSTVLIPARVVQALQLHFDQMAATSGPKAGGFPPLHDVLVCNRDGMYSLQQRHSQNAPFFAQTKEQRNEDMCETVK